MSESKTTNHNYFRLFLEAVKGSEQEYTSGSIRRAIFMLAVPAIIEMLGEAFFAVIDMAFVSRISTNAIATVGFTEQMLFVIYSVAIGLSMSVTAMVSRRVGEKNPKAASRVTMQAIILAIAIGAITGTLGVVFAPQLLSALGASDGVINDGLPFTRVMLGSNVVIMLLFMINGAFRGAGNASLAMRSLLLANGINLVLDPILIFGLGPIPAMGLTGAGIATAVGRGIGVFLQLYILLSGSSMLKMIASEIKIDLAIIKNLLWVSIGGIGQFLIETASWIFLVAIVAKSGTEAVAGYQIGFRIIGFTILPAWGMAQAASALVGQNLGAGHPERAEQSVWKASKYNFYYLLLISVVFYLGAGFIVSTFFTDTPSLVEYSKNMLKIICLGYIFFAFGMTTSAAFNGAGDTLTPTFINVLVLWVIQIPLAYFLAIYLNMQVIGVFMTIAICHSIHALVSVFFFKRGRWKVIKV